MYALPVCSAYIPRGNNKEENTESLPVASVVAETREEKKDNLIAELNKISLDNVENHASFGAFLRIKKRSNPQGIAPI